MADPKIRLSEMLGKLKGRNFRITPQRFAVVKILALSDGHPSVEMIYEEVKKDFPTTSIATVYKTVSLLKDLKEVLELGFPEGGNRYDGNRPFPHPHVICVKCKKIVDPKLDSLTDMTEELVSDTGFEIISHRVDFFGFCPECKRKRG
ncbi:MAG: transcriptional repressor [Deltaproteobacteria bacterium]|nr:transcriptional repressor [Deltaproteobacteria bacterium]MBW2138685.1 transcriptional repressor [Deltaproteobacteria bacterium]